MNRLVLIRHAKAAHPGGPDLDRPLAPKGIEQLASLATLLRPWVSGSVAAVVSPARRTRETYEGLRKRVPELPQPIYAAEIYEAVPGALLEVVQGIEAATAVLVGHSPGIPRLAQLLSQQLPAEAEGFIRSFPTSGCVVLEAAEEFSSWTLGCAEVRDHFCGGVDL